MLMGIALIFAQVFTAEAQDSVQGLSIDTVREFHQDFLHGSNKLSLLQEKTAPLPYQARSNYASNPNDLVALNSNINRDLSYGGEPGSAPRINYMDISLDKITVIAINMGRGGNAIATSNIMITPVQSQCCTPSQPALSDKLK